MKIRRPAAPARARLAARRALLRRLLAERVVTSQDEVLRLLREHGHRLTQATASRDLAAIGADKRADPDGVERYVVAGLHPRRSGGQEELVRLMQEFVVDVGHSANLAVVRTTPGAAPTVASALDRTPLDGVLGTLAGDDTVLVVARSARGGAPLASHIERMLEGMA